MRGRDDTRGDGEREREKKGARERERREVHTLQNQFDSV